MNAMFNDKIVKATELTRAGRLKEALALLRGPAAPAPAPAQKLNLLDRLAAFTRRAPAPMPDMLTPALTPAPTPTPPRAPGARFEPRSFTNAHGTRAYKLFIPSGYHGQPVPVVVMLHGCTQSPDDFAAGTRMNELGEANTILVAYPAQSKRANLQKCWNWFNPADQTRDRGEPAIIAGMVSQIKNEFAVKPDKIFAAGLSAGGALAAILGATYPDLFAAIGVHSGLACGAASDMQSAFAAMRSGGAKAKPGNHPVPTIVFHGDKDHTVNAANAEQVITQAEAGSLFTSAVTETPGYTRTIETGPGGAPILEKWILHGAGHAWSGGSPAGTFTNPAGPDASREMLRFFLESRK
jgi:poly(hydroxyalkanoate) depolymerase family esterase